ncbi:hypothetical protein [Rahnella victoriana]|uniref:hypothetical protein n=1 Tax=Rahnella victoriana TaxID=1510570 RepID=UPI000BB17EE1|nr:hypothetical protein [Rahnella victoriana]
MKKALFLCLLGFSVGASSAPHNLQIPSDPNATYTVIDTGKQGDLVTITTKREGKSGVSFSKRAYDCGLWQVMYLGTGESLEEMKSSKPDDHLSPIFEGSIADYVGAAACKK